MWRAYRQWRKDTDCIGLIYDECVSKCKHRGEPCTFHRDELGYEMICKCCGKILVPSQGMRTRDSPSVDCVDPRLGYVTGNVRLICWRCNDIKTNALFRELVNVLKYIGVFEILRPFRKGFRNLLLYLRVSDTILFRLARAR